MEGLGELALGEALAVGQKAGVVLPRLLLALTLASVLAWRRWKRGGKRGAEMAQTQVLMCVAAALVASVIGDSLARAFGVVGLGGFIRFRSGVKDPRDAAGLFLLIGLGMACGLGATEVALAGWVFVTGLFLVLDRVGKRKAASERWRLILEGPDAAAFEPGVVKALEKQGLTSRSRTVDAAGGRAVFEIEGPEGAVQALQMPWENVRSVQLQRIEGEVAA